MLSSKVKPLIPRFNCHIKIYLLSIIFKHKAVTQKCLCKILIRSFYIHSDALAHLRDRHITISNAILTSYKISDFKILLYICNRYCIVIIT